MGQALRKNNNGKKNKAIRNKKVRKIESKEEYFIRNGGILVEKRIALGLGQDIGTGGVKILSAKEIESATCCPGYEHDVIPSHVSVDWVPYKATLKGLTVSIIEAVELNSNSHLANVALTDISTCMVMNHENIGSVYGFCLETCVPIVVRNELHRNLYHHLHEQGAVESKKNLKWVHILKIAAEVSHALSYMHCALSKPVVHRDVNSHMIVLDDSFKVKLTGFGYSVVITPASANQRWPVYGTPGYVDPEHVKTQLVTEMCDVYSFGVLMLEMLTGQHPPTMLSSTELDLVDVFVTAVGKNRMMEIIDSDVLEQASVDEIEQFADLALTCVAKKGADRPTIVQVTSKLWQIRDLSSK